MGNRPVASNTTEATVPAPRRRSASDSQAVRRRSQLLNKLQKRLIISSWHLARPLVGERVIEHLLTRNQLIKTFLGLKTMNLEQILNQPRFAIHAENVRIQLDHIVENLEELEELETEFYRLGVQQAEVVKSLELDGFDMAEYWRDITEAIVWSVSDGRKDVHAAWLILVTRLVDKMRDGIGCQKLARKIKLMHQNSLKLGRGNSRCNFV